MAQERHMSRLYQVDAFTDTPFKGNPAGVCILNEAKTEEWMLQVAAEMNLSETAFVHPITDGYSLSWFTPKTEVSLCGHATLATAHILWEEGLLQASEKAVFQTKSGTLSAKKRADSIELDFPSKEIAPTESNLDLNTALNVSPVFTGVNVKANGNLYLLEVESQGIVEALKPDFVQLAKTDARAVIVTSRSEGGAYDFVSRFFAPAVGIDEDPVTGSSHCYLTPYWAARLGKKRLTGFQASRRTGTIICSLEGDRVILRGKAVTIFRAELVV
jgi:PhzF family phenazine biosynthesis protein